MWRALLALSKPRIVGLLTLTGLAGLAAAGGAGAVTTLAFLVAGAGTAAGAAILNCWYDRDLDRRMARTADRPLPAGEMRPRTALAAAAVALGVAWTVGLAALPLVAMGFVWLGFVAYVGLYTIGLKRRHWIATVLGGSAGAAPVLAGWTVTDPLSATPLAMAAVVFVWTPAHAWALATAYRADFAAARVPKLPVVAGPAVAARRSLAFAVGTVLVTAVAVAGTGWLTTSVAAIGAVALLVTYVAWARSGADPDAVRAFFTSNAYLALVFLGWAVEGQVGYSLSVPATTLAAPVAAAAFVALWRRRPSLGGVRASPSPLRGPRRTAPGVDTAEPAAPEQVDRAPSGGDAAGGP